MSRKCFGAFEKEILLLFRLPEEAQIHLGQNFGRFARTLVQRLDLESAGRFVEQKEAHLLNGKRAQQPVRHFGQHLLLIGLRT